MTTRTRSRARPRPRAKVKVPAADLSHPPGAYFDADAADRAVAFFPAVLKHSKGEWAGTPFTLAPWQRDEVIRPLFGWMRADGTRQYRVVYVEVPRKNGKSTLGAGVAMLLTFADREPGAEVYSCAADRDQAAIVFDQAKAMCLASDALESRAGVFRRSIVYHDMASTYHVLSADAYTKHGKNSHGVIFDELHAQPNRELFDVMQTSMGSRRQPVMFIITTAGVYSSESIGFQMHEYAENVRNGVIDDPSFLPVIYAAGPDADWTDAATWQVANPGYGDTVKPDYLAQECTRAQASPQYQNTFRRLHLNQWTKQDVRWLEMHKWDRCNHPVPDAALAGRPCYVGLDLASKVDVAAAVYVFPPTDTINTYDVRCRFWVPHDNAVERSRQDRVGYDAWIRDGHMIGTPGTAIDYGHIVADLAADAERYDIREVAADPWNAGKVLQELDAAGVTVLEMPQFMKHLNPGSKELVALLQSRRLRHGGHPVLRWMAGNVTAKTDENENIRPDKKRSREKIDGIVALVMALGRALVARDSSSVYENRGVMIV